MEAKSCCAALERNLSMSGAQKQNKAWSYNEHRGRIAGATSPIRPSLVNRNAGDRQ
jgi:hypothetical protein